VRYEKRGQHIDGPGGCIGRRLPSHDEPERRRKEFLDGRCRDAGKQQFSSQLLAYLVDERIPTLGSARLGQKDEPRNFPRCDRGDDLLDNPSRDRPVSRRQHGCRTFDRLCRLRP